MDFIKNLPAPVRFGIPAVLVLVIGLVAWMTMFKAPPPVVVVETQDIGVANFAKNALGTQQISYEAKQDAGTFVIEVSDGDATKAAETLAASGIKDRTGLAKKINCPAPPGFTATKAANERSANCEDAKAVQSMLLTAGAIAANVSVSQMENGTLLGPEKSKNVVAQVFLPEHMEGKWNAEQAAGHISKAVGTTIDRVSIADDELQTMFDGATTSSTSEASSGGGGSTACRNMDTATEIETKKDAVRACYEWRIGQQLTKLLDGSDRYVLTVEPTIQSVASTVTIMKQTRGPITDKSAQKSGDSSNVDVQSPANTEEQTRVIPAGAISSLRIAVTLDRESVTQDRELAVKRMLSTYVDPKRRDPAPSVTLAKLTGAGGGGQSGDELKEIKKAATQKTDQAPMIQQAKPEMPKWGLALMAVLVIGMVTAVLVLWRRSAAMAAERQRLEAAFQNDQRLLENFAQQRPDQLAAELNALFGAPPAQERSFH